MSGAAGNWPTWLPLRADLQALAPYGAPQISDVIALNTNENPNLLPAQVQSALLARISDVLANLNRYPDRDARSLRSALAQYLINQNQGLTLSVENIWAANGSNEILQTLFLAFGGAGASALGFTPSYSVHPLIAQITGTAWLAGARTADYEIDLPAAISQIRTHQPKLVFVTTPNNPTGTCTPLGVISQLAQEVRNIGALLVVDEAYAEFSEEPSAVTLISSAPHVVVSRTMSKAFAFAGVRLGYLAGDQAVVNACLVTRLPYHLSALTQVAAQVALEHAELMQSGIDLLVSERELVARGLRELGLTVWPSAANFLLVGGFPGDAHLVWEEFLAKGILIRDIGMPGKLRVTIGTQDENAAFLSAAAEIFNTNMMQRGE